MTEPTENPENQVLSANLVIMVKSEIEESEAIAEEGVKMVKMANQVIQAMMALEEKQDQKAHLVLMVYRVKLVFQVQEVCKVNKVIAAELEVLVKREFQVCRVKLV